MIKLINGIEVELNPDEVADYNARQAAWDAQAPQRLIDDCQAALELLINTKAAEKSYSSGISCASYKDSTNDTWALEATAFIEWRDNCYEYAYDYEARAQQGEIQNPSVEDFLTSVPTLTWPD